MKIPFWMCGSIFMQLGNMNVRYGRHPRTWDVVPWDASLGHVIPELESNTSYGNAGFAGLNALTGLHRVIKHDMKDLMEHLNANRVGRSNEWAYIGIDLEGDEAGVEHMPILYQPSQWQLRGSTTYQAADPPPLPSRKVNAYRTKPITVGCFRNRKTGIDMTVMNSGYRRRYEAAVGKASLPVLGEPLGFPSRTKLLETRERACTASLDRGPGFKVNHGICQYLTQHIIPFYDALLEIPVNQTYADLGYLLKSDTPQDTPSGIIVSIEQNHMIVNTSQEVVNGLDQDVCHINDRPLFFPHGFEVLANTSSEGMCYPDDWPLVADGVLFGTGQHH